jgi:hypothetical protein
VQQTKTDPNQARVKAAALVLASDLAMPQIDVSSSKQVEHVCALEINKDEGT